MSDTINGTSQNGAYVAARLQGSCFQRLRAATGPLRGSVRGSEFVRRIQALGKVRGVEVRRTAHRGKGSHGLLYYGSNITTVRNLKDEIDKRAYHNMLKQLRLSEKDFD